MNKSRFVLNNRFVIKVSGDYTKKFLQTILSNDLNNLKFEKIQYSLLLTPRGKLLYDFFIFHNNNDYYLDAPLIYVHDIVSKLRLYAMRIQLNISLETDIKIFFSDQRLGQLSFRDPRHTDMGYRTYTIDNITSESNDIYYTDMCFKCLIPQIDREFSSGEYLALHLNMYKINAISLSKGCYLGQEAISKIFYKSKNLREIAILQDQSTLSIKEKYLYLKNDKIGIFLSKHNNQIMFIKKLYR